MSHIRVRIGQEGRDPLRCREPPEREHVDGGRPDRRLCGDRQLGKLRNHAVDVAVAQSDPDPVSAGGRGGRKALQHRLLEVGLAEGHHHERGRRREARFLGVQRRAREVDRAARAEAQTVKVRLGALLVSGELL